MKEVKAKRIQVVMLFCWFFAYALGWGQTNDLLVKINRLESTLNKTPYHFETVEKLVDAYLYRYEYDKALITIDNYLDNIHPKGIRLAKAYLCKAEILKFKDESAPSFVLYKKAHDVFVQYKQWDLVVFSNAKLMEFYRRFAKHKLGLELAKSTESLILLHRITAPKVLNTFYNRYAALYNEQAQNKRSLTFSLKALEYANQLNDPNLKAISYNEMGFSYKNLMLLSTAILYYEKAEREWERFGYAREALNVALNIAEIKSHNQLVNLDEQIVLFKEVYTRAKNTGIHDYDAAIYHYLSTCYYFKKDPANELKYYRLAVQVDQENNKKMNDVFLKKAEEKYKNGQLKDKLTSEKIERNREKEEKQKTQLMLWIVAFLTLVATSGFMYTLRLQRRIKKSYEEIKIKDAQKNMLISEIHHRVKNNLQYVRSMLDLQLSIVSERGDKQNLEDVSRRIQAMTLVHELLYTKDDSAGLNIKEYLERLFENLTIGFSNQKNPTLEFDISALQLSITEATSIGIICAELFNNSVKYAFPNHQDPVFKISLSKSNNLLVLKVSDNGIKSTVPQDANDENRKKLGMRIIDIFARQLRGEYQISMENGYFFELSFEFQDF